MEYDPALDEFSILASEEDNHVDSQAERPPTDPQYPKLLPETQLHLSHDEDDLDDIPVQLRLHSIPFTGTYFEEAPESLQQDPKENVKEEDDSKDTVEEKGDNHKEAGKTSLDEEDNQNEPPQKPEVELEVESEVEDSTLPGDKCTPAQPETPATLVVGLANMEDFQSKTATDREQVFEDIVTDDVEGEEKDALENADDDDDDGDVNDSAEMTEGGNPVAVQKTQSGHVVINFTPTSQGSSPARNFKHTEEDDGAEGSRKQEDDDEIRGACQGSDNEKNESGYVPISDRIGKFEQFSSHQTDTKVPAGACAFSPSALDSRTDKQAEDRQHVNEQVDDSEELFLEEKFDGPRRKAEVDTTTDFAQRGASVDFDRENDQEVGESFVIIPDPEKPDEEDDAEFSTPSSSPAPETALDQQKSEVQQQNVSDGHCLDLGSQQRQEIPQSQKHQSGQHLQDAEQTSTPSAEDACPRRPSSTQMKNQIEARNDSPADLQRFTPSPSMQGGHAASGAFRPVPHRPQYWEPPQMMPGYLPYPHPQRQSSPSWPPQAAYPPTSPGIRQERMQIPPHMHHSYSEPSHAYGQSEGEMPHSESYHSLSYAGSPYGMPPEYYGPYSSVPHQNLQYPGYQSPVPDQYPGDPEFHHQQLLQWQQQQLAQQQQQHRQQSPRHQTVRTPGPDTHTPQHQGAEPKNSPTARGQTPLFNQQGTASPVLYPALLDQQQSAPQHSPGTAEEHHSRQGGPATPGAAGQKPPLSTVRVAGLDGTVDMELLQLYFEAPKKSGGGDIASIDDRRDEGYILVTFDDAAVAARVVERPQTVSGRTVNVSLYEEPDQKTPDAEDSACTIQVLGGPVVLDYDMMELYFSNSRKSGGGDIAKLEVLEKSEMALITFKDLTTAARVVGRPHTVSGRPLTVTLYEKPPEAPEPSAPGDAACMVRVTGGPVVLDKDMIDLYFSNNRKSGGGEIAKLEVFEEEEAALITFTDPSVAKAVVDRGHTVGKTKLFVEHYIPTAPQPATKILVQGLVPKACDEEFLQLFFEKEGGGDVTEVQLNATKKEAVITFMEACSVEKVVEKTNLKVGGGAVTVSVYSAPMASRGKPASTSAPHQQPTGQSTDAISSPQPCCTVEVRGIGPKTTLETLKFYFENKRRSHGGPVEDIEHNAKAEVAFIRFKDADTVQRVLACEHTVDGFKLQLSLKSAKEKPRLADNVACQTKVCVRGLPMTTSREYISDYFENVRRSGGGDVTEVVASTKDGVFYVIFQDAKVALRVLGKKHTIDNHKVKLSIPSPQTQAEAPAQDDEVEPLTTVCVRGLPFTTSQDYLVNYFENNRRSGGGDVTDVKTDAKREAFYVTFEKAEDAAQVCGRKHKLDGRELSVALYKPPAMYKDRLLIKNIPEISSAQNLQLYVESVVEKASIEGVEVLNILFSGEEGTAVVIFDKDIGDYKHIRETAAKKPFQKCQLSLEQIPVSATVLVTNLPADPPVSEDTLENYFENAKRSDGGDVVGVELMPGLLSALVTFAEADVAIRVARKQHSIGKQPVKVSVYMECLGISGGHQEPTVPLPPPMVLDNRDMDMLDRLLILPAGLEHLQRDLEERYGRLELNKSAHTASVHCTVSPKDKGARNLVKVWTENVRQVLNVHWKDIHKRELTLTPEEFREVEGMVGEVVAVSNRNIGHQFNAENGRLTLVCRGDQKVPGMEKLMSDLRQAQVGLERKKKEKTERIDQHRAKLRMLRGHRDLENLMEKHPQLSINVSPDESWVEVRGLHEEIQEAKFTLRNIFSELCLSEYKWESDLHKKLMEKDIAKEMVLRKCLEAASTDVQVEMTPEGVTAVSLIGERAEMVRTTAQQLIQRRQVKFPDSALQAVQSQAWQQAKAQILEEAEGTLVMQEDAKSLTLVSVHQKTQQFYDHLKGILQESSVREHQFPLPKVLHKLFKPFLQKKITDLQLSIDDFNFDEYNGKVTLRGSAAVINSAQNIYRIFREVLVVSSKTFKQPSVDEFFSGQDWLRKREVIEHQHECLIVDPKDLPDDFHSVDAIEDYYGFSPSESGVEEDRTFLSSVAKSPSSGLPTSRKASKVKKDSKAGVSTFVPTNRPKVSMPARPRLYLSVMSDITKEEHHVLVNSSNVHLNMSQGQVSKALLEVGGDVIQQDLKANYPQGIQVGDVAVSQGGKLMCKKLFHCVLPESKDEQQIKKVVTDAVMKCMAEVEKLRMGSIGFPSLGTGNLGYPAALVAQTMFQAALDYGRQNPSTVISDVFFILHKKDSPLTQVFKQEEAFYKQALIDSRRPEPAEEEEIVSVPANPDAQGVKQFMYFEEKKASVAKLIIGMSDRAVQQTYEAVVSCYKSLVGRMECDVPKLDQWDTLHIESLKNACRLLFVNITYNYSMGRLILEGFKSQLDRVPVHPTIKEAEEAVHRAENASLLQKQVQWNRLEIAEDGEYLVPYPALANYNIEMAYQKNDPNAFFTDEHNMAYMIKFASMEEVPEGANDDDEDPIRVMRQNKIASLDVAPPKEWTSMGNSDMDVLQIKENSAEYQAVHEKFMTSLSSPASKVAMIYRVQNLTLFKQYAMMKQQMEAAMPSGRACERRDLWHGTKEEAVDGIMKYGFNRSYSNSTKSAYGQGAYFATTAEYSSRNEYAVASPQTNQRNMFLCKVLVGQYTVGKSDMRTPPTLDGSGKRYDSTVDDVKSPSIFVTYSDVQAYPEYRIVFTDS